MSCLQSHQHSCYHESKDSEWLPTENGILRLHPYCSNCGSVKNVSSDRAKGLGYFANVLSRIRNDLERRGYKISKAQIRMIMEEIKKKEIGDTYSFSFTKQKKLFVDVAAKYIKVNKNYLESYL